MSVHDEALVLEHDEHDDEHLPRLEEDAGSDDDFDGADQLDEGDSVLDDLTTSNPLARKAPITTII
jgi:hypothetical protein